MSNKPNILQNGKGQFAAGKSGNPAGRPAGSRNKSTILIESLLEAESERLTRKAIDLAVEGDIHALRLCMERLLPPRRDRLIDLRLPPLEGVEQLASAACTVMQAIGDGQITPTEGETLTNILAIQCDLVSSRDLYRRVEALEQAMPSEKNTNAREAAESKAVDEEIVRTLKEGRTCAVESSHAGSEGPDEIS